MARTAHNSTLKPGKPLKRKKPPQPRIKRTSANRKGSKKRTVPDWKKLRNQADSLASQFYRNKPCVICTHLKIFNPNSCWHHYAGRYPSHLRHDPANLMPLCFTHHKGGNDICAHSDNGFASRAFTDIIEKTMPKRIAKLNKSRNVTLKDRNMTQADIYQQAIDFWQSVVTSHQSYVSVCETAQVEAYTGEKT